MTQKPRLPKERCGEAGEGQDESRSRRSRSAWDGMEAAEVKGRERMEKMVVKVPLTAGRMERPGEQAG